MNSADLIDDKVLDFGTVAYDSVEKALGKIDLCKGYGENKFAENAKEIADLSTVITKKVELNINKT